MIIKNKKSALSIIAIFSLSKATLVGDLRVKLMTHYAYTGVYKTQKRFTTNAQSPITGLIMSQFWRSEEFTDLMPSYVGPNSREFLKEMFSIVENP